MTGLASCITKVIVDEYGHRAFLERVADPFWFQAFGCVLGFDWHSSGVTTVTGGALKEALSVEEHGIALAGGKGKASKRTLEDLDVIGKEADLGEDQVKALKYSSRMCAKVDNAALQDGHQLYYHVILVTGDGDWTIVQQGLDGDTGFARRYHWLSDSFDDLVLEPHKGIVGEKAPAVLDMTARESAECQRASVDLVNDGANRIKAMMREPVVRSQATLDEFLPTDQRPALLTMPQRINWNVLRQVYDFRPSNYEELLSFKGVGPATVRALALVAEVVHGAGPSYKDPVKFSFAVGGKDGVPYPVDRKAMDESISILRRAIEESRAGDKDRLRSIERLRSFVPQDFEW
jgi:hypothetical protein